MPDSIHILNPQEQALHKEVNDLYSRLAAERPKLDESAAYYDATNRLDAIGIAVPEPMRCLTASIGWPRMYVDAIEERLDIEGFRIGEDTAQIDRLREWWAANDLDEESGLAHLDALIYGRSYVTVSAPGPGDTPGVPNIRVESPLDMVVDTDPRTRQVTRAARFYFNDAQVSMATLYRPNETIYLEFDNGLWLQTGKSQHNLGRVPVVAVVNRERLSHREGSSEITEELRSFTDAASRVMMDMQAAAELMAVPQRVLFGVSAEQLAPTGSPSEVLNSYLAQILAFSEADGKVQQFQAAELMNYVNVLQELAKHVASYTGLPPQYLSFSSENPASAEAIKSAESRLVKKCERKGRLFGGSWEQVMRLAVLVIDKEEPAEMARLETVWRDPSTPTYAAKADAAVKMYAAGQGVIPKNQARLDMGYTDEQIAAMDEMDAKDKVELKKLADILKPAPNPSGSPGNTSRSSGNAA